MHAFRSQCASLTLQSKSSMQLPEPWSAMTYKERSGGLTAKAVEPFKGVDVLHEGEHTGMSTGHAICLVA